MSLKHTNHLVFLETKRTRPVAPAYPSPIRRNNNRKHREVGLQNGRVLKREENVDFYSSSEDDEDQRNANPKESYGSMNFFLEENVETDQDKTNKNRESLAFKKDAGAIFALEKEHRQKKIKKKWKKIKAIGKTGVSMRKSSQQSIGLGTVSKAFAHKRSQRLPKFKERLNIKKNLADPKHFAKRHVDLKTPFVHFTTSNNNKAKEMRRVTGSFLASMPLSRSFARRDAVKSSNFLYGNDFKNQQKSIFFKKFKRHQFVDHRAITPQTHYMHECEKHGILPNPKFIKESTATEINLNHLSLGDDTTEALSESLNMSKKVKKIQMQCCNIGTGAKALFRQLSSTVQSLDISHNDIGKDNSNIMALKTLLLSESHPLTEIDISYNKLGDKSAITLLSALLEKRNRHIGVLKLAGNQLQRAAPSLSGIIKRCKGLKTLDISDNCFTGSTAGEIFKSLEDNDSLIELDMSSNGIGSSPIEEIHDSMEKLSHALQRNVNLKHLILSENMLEYEQLQLIVPGLMKNTTLLGLHLGGSAARIDSWGFLTPLSHDQSFERLDGHIKQNNNFRGRRDCCYYCGMYVSICLIFDFRLTMKPFDGGDLFIHISSDNWNHIENFFPIKLQHFNNCFSIMKNVPPGKLKFFFSCNGKILLSNAYPRSSLEEHVDMIVTEEMHLLPTTHYDHHSVVTDDAHFDMKRIKVTQVNVCTVNRETASKMVQIRQTTSVLKHHKEHAKYAPVIGSVNEEKHHEHAHIDDFHQSIFAHTSYLKQYHDKLEIACRHDWEVLDHAVYKLWERVHSNKNDIKKDMQKMYTGAFSQHFGLTDRIYRLFSVGVNMPLAGWLDFLRSFDIIEIYKRIRANRIMNRLKKSHFISKSNKKKKEVRGNKKTQNDDAMSKSLTEPRVKKSGRASGRVNPLINPIELLEGEKIIKKLKGCFSNACIAKEQAIMTSNNDKSGIDALNELRNEDGHYMSNLSRAYFYLAIFYLARTLRPSKMPTQATQLLFKDLVNNNYQVLQDSFAIKHVFTKNSELLFQRYGDSYRKLFEKLLTSHNMSRHTFEEFCFTLFGPKFSKKVIDRAFTISLPFPSYGENSVEIGLPYESFLEAYCRVCNRVNLDIKMVKAIKNVTLPFEHGRPRSMFLFMENREDIINNQISVEKKVAIISELLFGRIQDDSVEVLDESNSESDFYSSESSDSDTENMVNPHRHLHHHHHSHKLHVGVHAAIIFKKSKVKHRRACTVSSINIDGTFDVVLSHPYHHKVGKKERRECIRNVQPSRIVGRRHIGTKCLAKKNGWIGKPKKAIIVNCNDDSSYDVELLGDNSISIGLLEEEIFDFVEEPPPLERKHKDVLYRFARKILANRNIKKIEKKQNALGKLILKISKALGTGMLTHKIGLAMIATIKEHLAAPQAYSGIQQAIRLEKLDQLLNDAKNVISLSHEQLYDKKTKQILLPLMSLWKKSLKEDGEASRNYVAKQTTFDSVLL